METKRTVVTWFLVVGVVMTTLLVAASPVVNPSEQTEKERNSSAMKNKPKNRQQPQALTSTKLHKVLEKMQRQGKTANSIMTLDPHHVLADKSPMKPDPSHSSSSSSSSSAALTSTRNRKNIAPPGQRKNKRTPAPDITKVAGQSSGKGGGEGKGGKEGRRSGKGGTTERETGKGRKGRDKATGRREPVSDVRLQQPNGFHSGLTQRDDSLPHAPPATVDIDELKNGRQKQMASEKAEVSEESVGLEHDYLQPQEVMSDEGYLEGDSEYYYFSYLDNERDRDPELYDDDRSTVHLFNLGKYVRPGSFPREVYEELRRRLPIPTHGDPKGALNKLLQEIMYPSIFGPNASPRTIPWSLHLEEPIWPEFPFEEDEKTQRYTDESREGGESGEPEEKPEESEVERKCPHA